MWAADALDANHIFIVVNDRIDIHISPSYISQQKYYSCQLTQASESFCYLIFFLACFDYDNSSTLHMHLR